METLTFVEQFSFGSWFKDKIRLNSFFEDGFGVQGVKIYDWDWVPLRGKYDPLRFEWMLVTDNEWKLFEQWESKTSIRNIIIDTVNNLVGSPSTESVSRK